MFSSKNALFNGTLAIARRFCTQAMENVSSVPSSKMPAIDKLYKKVQIEMRGNEKAVMKSYGEFLEMAAKYLDIKVTKNWAPIKPNHERFTVLKSRHVHKKHRVQYEYRTYYRFVDLEKLTESSAQTYLEYVERNLPEGVALKVSKVEMRALPESIATPPVEN